MNNSIRGSYPRKLDSEDGYLARLRNVSRRVRPRNVAEQRLLLLALLPLFDGVAVSALVGHVLTDVRTTVGFGVNVFSGAGCLSIALALAGSRAQRVAAVARVYLLWVFPLGLLAAAFASVVTQALLPEFVVFSALILIGLALEFAGVGLAPRGPRPSSVSAQWSWALRLVSVPQIVLVIGLAASLLNVFRTRPALSLQPSLAHLSTVTMAIVAGMVLTLIGALVGELAQEYIDPAAVRLGGAIGLFSIALLILGVPVPEITPLASLIAGLVVGVCKRVLTVSTGRDCAEGCR